LLVLSGAVNVRLASDSASGSVSGSGFPFFDSCLLAEGGGVGDEPGMLKMSYRISER